MNMCAYDELYAWHIGWANWVSVCAYFSHCQIGFVSTGCVGYKMVPLSWFAMKQSAENELAQIKTSARKVHTTHILCVGVRNVCATELDLVLNLSFGISFFQWLHQKLGSQSEAMRGSIHQGKADMTRFFFLFFFV